MNDSFGNPHDLLTPPPDAAGLAAALAEVGKVTVDYTDLLGSAHGVLSRPPVDRDRAKCDAILKRRREQQIIRANRQPLNDLHPTMQTIEQDFDTAELLEQSAQGQVNDELRAKLVSRALELKARANRELDNLVEDYRK